MPPQHIRDPVNISSLVDSGTSSHAALRLRFLQKLVRTPHRDPILDGQLPEWNVGSKSFFPQLHNLLQRQYTSRRATQPSTLASGVLQTRFYPLHNQGPFPLRYCADDLEQHFAVWK